MSTVFQRTIRASPERTADDAWRIIVDLIAPNAASAARKDLNAISGIAATIIAARYPKNNAIVIYGGGPRIRFYCIYDDTAASGDGAKEDKLASSPIDGDWKMTFPCGDDDLEWLKRALNGKPARFSIRSLDEALEGDDNSEQASQKTVGIDIDAFLKS